MATKFVMGCSFFKPTKTYKKQYKGDSFFSNIPFSISSKLSILWRIVANKNGLLREHTKLGAFLKSVCPIVRKSNEAKLNKSDISAAPSCLS